MTKLLFLLLSSQLFLASFNASATLTYSALAKSTFTLLDSGGLIISADVGLEGPMTMTSGTGIASIDSDMQSDPSIFPASALVQESSVSGSAGAPLGSSSAAVLNSFLIDLDNSDSFAKTAVFEFVYDWDISLSQAPIADALFEAGIASAFFHLSGFAPSGSETLAIDEGMGLGVIPVPDWLFHPFISFDFDEVITPISMTGSTTVLAYVTVPAFSRDRFSVITDADGSARHVPEPFVIHLVACGLLLLAFKNRKK